jgi:hypothetical protein
LIVDVSEVKLKGESKQNKLPPEYGEPIDGGGNCKSLCFEYHEKYMNHMMSQKLHHIYSVQEREEAPSKKDPQSQHEKKPIGSAPEAFESQPVIRRLSMASMYYLVLDMIGFHGTIYMDIHSLLLNPFMLGFM